MKLNWSIWPRSRNTIASVEFTYKTASFRLHHLDCMHYSLVAAVLGKHVVESREKQRRLSAQLLSLV